MDDATPRLLLLVGSGCTWQALLHLIVEALKRMADVAWVTVCTGDCATVLPMLLEHVVSEHMHKHMAVA